MAHFGWRKKLDIWLCKKFGHKPMPSNSPIVGIFCVRCGKMAHADGNDIKIGDEVIGQIM